MRLFLASLGMLFGGCLVGYLVIRLRAPEWPPPGSPGLPGGLWISTLVLVLLSAVLVLAERAVRDDRTRDLSRLLWVALLLAIAFLAAQLANWIRMAADSVTPQQSLLAFGFWVLTFLHAAHVLLGLIPLVFIALRARGGRYTAADHEGVHLVAMYWHFLLATWVAIFGVLNF
jgi:cytochrome c oxidase subunit 3